MVFFQITGDRVTITNYLLSCNTCNTFVPGRLQTKNQSLALKDGWHSDPPDGWLPFNRNPFCFTEPFGCALFTYQWLAHIVEQSLNRLEYHCVTICESVGCVKVWNVGKYEINATWCSNANFILLVEKELKMLMEGIPKYSPVFLPLYIYVMASAKVGEKLSRNQ